MPSYLSSHNLIDGPVIRANKMIQLFILVNGINNFGYN